MVWNIKRGQYKYRRKRALGSEKEEIKYEKKPLKYLVPNINFIKKISS